MPKYLWLAIGAVLAVGGIALLLFDHLWAGIALIVISSAFELLFVKEMHNERRHEAKRSR